MTQVTRFLRVGALGSVLLTLCGPLSAQSVIDEWATVQAPPPPPLSKVTVDPRTTALLVLDIAKQTCSQEQRPRCIAMLPKVKKLLAMARTKGVFIIYTLGAASTPADILPEVAMIGSEPVVTSGPDKFVGTQLDQILKDKGIKTVITVGAAAHGAVLHTAAGSAFRGFNVIVPVDGMASESVYAEQYTAWHLLNAPRLATMVKLTTTGMID
jgi:nicotinamidase-related amidase